MVKDWKQSVYFSLYNKGFWISGSRVSLVDNFLMIIKYKELYFYCVAIKHGKQFTPMTRSNSTFSHGT